MNVGVGVGVGEGVGVGVGVGAKLTGKGGCRTQDIKPC